MPPVPFLLIEQHLMVQQPICISSWEDIRTSASLCFCPHECQSRQERLSCLVTPGGHHLPEVHEASFVVQDHSGLARAAFNLLLIFFIPFAHLQHLFFMLWRVLEVQGFLDSGCSEFMVRKGKYSSSSRSHSVVSFCSFFRMSVTLRI